jgi:hypothetical protein
MAVQKKIKLTEAEKKILNKTFDKFKNSSYKFKERSPRQRQFEKFVYEENIAGGPKMVNPANLCKNGTMAGCSATDLNDNEKIAAQKKCPFYKKASFQERCQFETFGEFCWCVEAQKDAKKG